MLTFYWIGCFIIGIVLFIVGFLCHNKPTAILSKVFMAAATGIAIADGCVINAVMWIVMYVVAFLCFSIHFIKANNKAYWWGVGALIGTVLSPIDYTGIFNDAAGIPSFLWGIIVVLGVFFLFSIPTSIIGDAVFKKQARHNKLHVTTSTIVGMNFEVVKRATYEEPGRINVSDIDWAIVPEEPGEVFEVGTHVIVKGISGVRLICVPDMKERRRLSKEARAQARAERRAAKKAAKEAKNAEKKAKKEEKRAAAMKAKEEAKAKKLEKLEAKKAKKQAKKEKAEAKRQARIEKKAAKRLEKIEKKKAAEAEEIAASQRIAEIRADAEVKKAEIEANAEIEKARIAAEAEVRKLELMAQMKELEAANAKKEEVVEEEVSEEVQEEKVEEVTEEKAEETVIEEVQEENNENLSTYKVVEEEVVEGTPAVEEAPVVEEKKAVHVPFVTRFEEMDEDTKNNYNTLKSEILAYGVKARFCRGGDMFRLHRKTYAKISVAGKGLKIYLALDPNDYADSTLPIKDVGAKKAYVDIPLCMKVKSPLSMKRALKLVQDTMEKDGLVKGEVVPFDWAKDIVENFKNKEAEEGVEGEGEIEGEGEEE